MPAVVPSLNTAETSVPFTVTARVSPDLISVGITISTKALPPLTRYGNDDLTATAGADVGVTTTTGGVTGTGSPPPPPPQALNTATAQSVIPAVESPARTELARNPIGRLFILSPDLNWTLNMSDHPTYTLEIITTTP